jgi:hypothetical protein
MDPAMVAPDSGPRSCELVLLFESPSQDGPFKSMSLQPYHANLVAGSSLLLGARFIKFFFTAYLVGLSLSTRRVENQALGSSTSTVAEPDWEILV